MDRNQQSGLFAALIELHRKKQQNRRRATDSEYARVLDHFERRAERLHEERLLTAELVGGAFEAVRSLPRPAAQQELEIIGPLGGTAAGRFRVRNRSHAPVVVECVAGEALSAPSPSIHFEPSSCELAAGASALIRVAADLVVFRAAGSCTVPVECRSGHRRDRLWLVVTAVDERGGLR